jgi:hypothetical protein
MSWRKNGRPVTSPRCPGGVGRHRRTGATRSGSWGSGSAARPGSPFPCATGAAGRLPPGPARLRSERTTSVRPTACAATKSTSAWAARRGWPRRAGPGRALGMRLILDFVPNHVAPDHPWTGEHPEYFIRGEAADAQSDPASFIETGGRVFACGRDPFFPAWPDVLQLNAFDPGLRPAARDTVLDIAGQCDGVRCDMAMLHAERRLRAHLGRSGPGRGRRGLLARSSRQSRPRGRISDSWPRPTGTWSGSCSSRGSTSATTSALRPHGARS